MGHMRLPLMEFCLVILGLLASLLYVQGHATHSIDCHPNRLVNARQMRVLLDNTSTIVSSSYVYNQTGQYIEVDYTTANPDAANDYVMLYVANATVGAVYPITYALASRAAPYTYNTTGRGTAWFQLYNWRSDLVVYLTKGGLVAPVVVAMTPPIVNTIPNYPSGGHLALHEDQKSIVAQWVSAKAGPQQVLQWAEVKNFTNPTANVVYKQQVSSNWRTYSASDMCGPPATDLGYLAPGWHHRAVIPGAKLKPNTKYVYRFGIKGDGKYGNSLSKNFTFTSPPRLHSCDSFKFVVLNDVGNGGNTIYDKPGQGIQFQTNKTVNASKTAPALVKWDNDAQLALLGGDLSYADGNSPGWDMFTQLFEEAFSHWPLMVAPGNHERDYGYTGDAFNNTSYDSEGECNTPYYAKFYTPTPDKYKSWYSFDMGSVHFLVLDTETVSGPKTPQGRFVASDLKKVDRTKTPWVFVVLHRMMYAPATYSKIYVGDLEVEARLQADFDDLFLKYKVDVVTQGHEHAYARSCQVHNNKCTRGAPYYILAGNAGASLTSGFQDPASMPEIYVFPKQFQNGYLRFFAAPTSLRMEAVSTDDGTVFDTYTLNK